MRFNILHSQKTHSLDDQQKNEPLACKDLVENIIVSEKGTITRATLFKGKLKPGFWLFFIINLMSSLPLVALGLLFYVLALGSRIINQQCSRYKSVNFRKCELEGIAPSPSYRLMLLFVILLA